MAKDTAGPLRLLRETHEERVLAVLRTQGAMTRAQLAEQTGLSRATLSSIVQHLLAGQALTETGAEEGASRGRGRPVTVLTLNPGGGLAVGMDLQHRAVQVTVANVAHEIVASTGIACSERTPWARRIELASELVESLAAANSLSLKALAGVGVGVVGPVPETGGHPATPEDSPTRAQGKQSKTHSRAARSRLVHDGLAERFDVPVYVDNNTRLAALGEAIWGAAAGLQNVLYLRLSYGVGSGLVLGGHLFSGAGGAAGELGHVSVDPEWPPCPCGGRGCLERYVSLGAVLEECGFRQFDEVLRRLEDGDEAVRSVIARAGERIGTVLAAACNTVNPEMVVIGGELAAAGDVLLDPVRDTVRKHTHSQVRRGLEITPATLGHDDAARGGIALVLRRSALLAGYPAAPADPASGARFHDLG
ncbi:putative NBD/HSP70 family sugar kinase [Kribbella amoyensis]|uniref:Putative NBD/HSP70 family sugar kinase n=1 Tax=Kribbella amoyensis TaxID=996641 RepID=A0A561B893_9ACTN|nr:ROK family transcriptional regulator [Kribbella amoyensis]TWD74912.1 putative NBD/HSP70 family sugar kinase [Kribbella amoyensis]